MISSNTFIFETGMERGAAASDTFYTDVDGLRFYFWYDEDVHECSETEFSEAVVITMAERARATDSDKFEDDEAMIYATGDILLEYDWR